MARRYRYEYRIKKLEGAKRRQEREEERQARVESRSDKEKELREVLSWIIYLVIVVCATYFIVTYVGQRTEVSGDSMEATLQSGDNLIVDKISYRFRDPKRFEIIVFPYKYQENTYYIKRIIGLPGETVQIKNGCIYINGRQLKETYGLEPILESAYGIAAEPVALGEDEYFVMGDNRNCSADSREAHIGPIRREDLIGRAWIRIWPFQSIGAVSHE